MISSTDNNNKPRFNSMRGKKILITGHTGFKGSWLSIWLDKLGANVYGLALPLELRTSLFKVASLESIMTDFTYGDVRDFELVKDTIDRFEPDAIIHLAAQAIVHEAIASPRSTFETNVMGTVNVLEAVRLSNRYIHTIIVTSDKCYENSLGAQIKPFTESARLGGKEPYAASKAAAELVTNAYLNTYGTDSGYTGTVRAGNVIGGGDFAPNRLIPDAIKAIASQRSLSLRAPNSVRPWQHVLTPLHGYLVLLDRVFSDQNWRHLPTAWNFGPDSKDTRTVSDVVAIVHGLAKSGTWHMSPSPLSRHETKFLAIDSSQARNCLDWIPRWDFDESINRTVRWYLKYSQDQHFDSYKHCINDINAYEQSEPKPSAFESIEAAK